MHPKHRFSELAESLKNGFLADEIVLALARAEKGENLDEGDREVLRKASAILESVVKGHQWLDDPKLSSETRSSANFFGRAVSALPKVYTSDSFLKLISQFRTTADQLAHGERPSQDKIQGLRTFFFNAAQSELDRTDELLTGEDTADALEWTAIDL